MLGEYIGLGRAADKMNQMREKRKKTRRNHQADRFGGSSTCLGIAIGASGSAATKAEYPSCFMLPLSTDGGWCQSMCGQGQTVGL